ANLEAEQGLIEDVKAAEAREKAAKFDAQKVIIEAGAKKDAADKEAEARKIIADAKAKEEATIGMSEAQVMHAKADASERQGMVDAIIIEKIAEAKRKEGLAEANVIQEKAIAEAKGIQEKAGAMKQLNDAGKEHEEFRLKLQKEKEVELAGIHIQKDIADAQATVLAEAFKTAKIDIVGGDNTFFDNLIRQVSNGKGIDKLVDNSQTITHFKDALLGGNGENGNSPDLIEKVKNMAIKYGITSEDIKNLSIATLIARVQMKASDEDKDFLSNISKFVSGISVEQKKLK
ncbi:flotillin, partial [Marivirga lumbricoides]